MTALFLLLFLASSVALIIGLIKPSVVLRWGKRRTRSRSSLIYGIAAFVLFIAFGVSAPNATNEPPSNANKPNNAVTATTSSSSTLDNSANSSTNDSINTAASTPEQTMGTVQSTDPQRRADPLAGVYHPYRLIVKEPFKTVSGTVDYIRHESDKDYHINLKLDAQYANLINDKNVSREHGDLVVEIIPMDADKVPVPHAGEHITVSGAYVEDTAHGWMEIHPAWFINGQGSASYTPAEAAASVQTGIDGNGDEESSTTTTSPSPTGSTSTSSGSGVLSIASSNLNVAPGSYASITVHTIPGVTGTIEVDYSSGPSQSSSLVPKNADASGNITWSWKVGSKTAPGGWKVIITADGKTIQTTLNVS